MKTQWRLDKNVYNFRILLPTLAAHTSTWWFRWFLTLYIFLFIGGFLRRFLVPETIHTLGPWSEFILWGRDLILPALQDCDAWPWCSLAGSKGQQSSQQGEKKEQRERELKFKPKRAKPNPKLLMPKERNGKWVACFYIKFSYILGVEDQNYQWKF
jgi:hypothetical protein